MYHVINRANGRQTIFHTKEDYQLFESILADAKDFFTMRILGYVIMPNHWHLILYPHKDGDLSRCMQWITLTHTKRIHARNKTTGHGHIYQGRYKSFIVQRDTYLVQLMRYVERNPVRAKLVRKGENWRWSSLWRRVNGSREQKTFLSDLPVDLPKDYLSWVNEMEDDDALASLRASVNKGTPLGGGSWLDTLLQKYNLSAAMREPGRPKEQS